jgi:hypothetical protein
VLQVRKKLIMACAAIAAFAAVVIAPVASASPILTSEGKAVAAGTEVKGTNTGNFVFSGPGGYTINCAQASLAAKVTGNSGTQIQLEAAGGLATSGTGASGDCTASWGPATLTWSKMCLSTVPKTDNLSITGCGGEILLTTNITGIITCKYAAGTVAATFPTNADATFRLSSLPMKRVEGESIYCPLEVAFDLDLDLTTTAGGTLFIS